MVWVPDVDAILLMLEKLDLGIPPTETILFERKLSKRCKVCLFALYLIVAKYVFLYLLCSQVRIF